MSPTSRRTIPAAAAAAAGAGLLVAFGRGDSHEPALIFTEGGYAIRGYDPVAYLAEGRPAEGDDAHVAEWNGTVWRFASAANRDAFVADPQAYAPQYGGFCAWAVAAKGELYSTRPENWSIVNGRLYLNFNDEE